jgi:hypothetical protein
MVLTTQEKIDIVTRHMRNIEESKYNTGLAVMYQQAMETPDQEKIDSYQESIASCDVQLTVLQEELTSLQAAL